MERNKIPLTETELAVLEVIASRWRKGRDHYKKGINYDQGEDWDWLDQAIEECADQLQYLVAMKLRMQNDRREKN
jgi:hypothetical protein